MKKNLKICPPWKLREKWNPALRVWMPQKVAVVGDQYVPVFRDGRPVFALPGGGEYVGVILNDDEV